MPLPVPVDKGSQPRCVVVGLDRRVMNYRIFIVKSREVSLVRWKDVVPVCMMMPCCLNADVQDSPTQLFQFYLARMNHTSGREHCQSHKSKLNWKCIFSDVHSKEIVPFCLADPALGEYDQQRRLVS